MSRSRYTGVSKDPKTGTYSYYFKAGVDLATGKAYQERRRGFKTAKEAFEARTNALNKVQKRGGVKHTQLNFKEFMELIFVPELMSSVRDDIENRRQYIFDELILYFGKKKPKDITVSDVIAYKTYVLEKYAKSYAKTKMVMLNRALKSAQNHGLIYHDIPTEKVAPISVKKPKVDFWTKGEFETVVFNLDRESYFEHFIFTLLWLYYFTGMRVNEGTALYWEDVNFKKKTLTISHNLQYVNRDNWRRSDMLKTESSRRIIGLDDTTIEVLKSWKERQAAHSEIDFILSHNGYPYPKRSILDQIKRFSKRAGVKYIQPKGLRHSHASLLINEYNLNALYISKRLGHSKVTTTLEVYSHLYPNADEEVTSKLNTLFSDKLPK